MKLFPTLFARRAVEFRREPAGEASTPAAHSERVTISEDARAASEGAGRPAVGDVRWYRAVRGASTRARGAASGVGSSDAPGAAPAPSVAATGRNAPAAIAAYRAGMALAA